MTPAAKDPPDLLASLPDGAIDPAALESLRAEVRDLAGQVAALSEAVGATRPEPVTQKTLEAWGEALAERLVAEVRAAAPAVDPIATEELRTGVQDLRQAMARLEKAVGRPVTPEALEAWGEALAKRVLEAARAADARSGSTESQRRMEEAAARIEKALERAEDRLRELKGMTEEGRAAASGTADGVTRIERREDCHRKIRKLSFASVCFLFLAFVLVPTAFVLDNMGFTGWAVHDALMFIAVLLAIVGAISGHVALKKIKVNPETPGKYRRLALAGVIIGYGGMVLCILVLAYFWFIVFPNAFSSH